MANLVIAFAEILAGGVLMDAAIKGDTIQNVVTGKATSHPFAGTSTSGGSTAATPGAAPGSGGSGSYVNPFGQAKGFQLGRTDQGVDANMTPGSAIVAPADSKIVAIAPNWYAGQPAIVAQITDGPLKGKLYYLAEQINPSVAVGDVVTAGQKIATYASSGTGIEFGWASLSGLTSTGFRTLAQATTGYTEGEVTAAGQSMLAFLKSLGV